jgi:hypothetical protein
MNVRKELGGLSVTIEWMTIIGLSVFLFLVCLKLPAVIADFFKFYQIFANLHKLLIQLFCLQFPLKLSLSHSHTLSLSLSHSAGFIDRKLFFVNEKLSELQNRSFVTITDKRERECSDT